MNADFVQVSQLWPLIAYFAAVLVVVGAMLAIPRVLASYRPERNADEPFESGIVAQGDIHVRFAVQYYPIAIFFVIFDLEAIFIFAWAVAVRETGRLGFIEILIFIGILLAALVYLWRIGALDWRTRRQRLQDAAFKH